MLGQKMDNNTQIAFQAKLGLLAPSYLLAFYDTHHLHQLSGEPSTYSFHRFIPCPLHLTSRCTTSCLLDLEESNVFMDIGGVLAIRTSPVVI